MTSAQMIPDDTARYTVITAEGECVEHHWKDKYDLTCHNCGYEQHIMPSLFQQMGQSSMGYGNCLSCKESLQVIHDPETNTMKSQELKGE